MESEYFFKQVGPSRFACAKFEPGEQVDPVIYYVEVRPAMRSCDCPGWFRSRDRVCKHVRMYGDWEKLDRKVFFVGEEPMPNPFLDFTSLKALLG